MVEICLWWLLISKSYLFVMQQFWLKLFFYCLGPGSALKNMFAWVIMAYLENLGPHLGSVKNFDPWKITPLILEVGF